MFMTGQIQFVLIKDKQTCLVIDKLKSVRLWFVVFADKFTILLYTV